MKFKIRCLNCAATCWANGWEEDDTNSGGVDEDQELEWEEYDPAEPLPHSIDCTCKMPDCPGVYMQYPNCPHEDYDIIDRDDTEDEYPLDER